MCYRPLSVEEMRVLEVGDKQENFKKIVVFFLLEAYYYRMIQTSELKNIML